MQQLNVSLKDHSFHFALPCYDGKVCTETVLGLLETSAQLTAMGVRHMFNIIRSGSLIDQTRNELVERFLQDTKSDILIFVDSDINFTWDGMSRLLAFSTIYPIVCGAYPDKKDDVSFIVNWSDNKLNEYGLLPIHSMGIGFTAIQRQVFETIPAEEYFHKRLDKNIKAFFRMSLIDGVYMGEDVYFFDSAVKAGFQPVLDPMISLGHVGIKEWQTPFSHALPNILNAPLQA